ASIVKFLMQREKVYQLTILSQYFEKTNNRDGTANLQQLIRGSEIPLDLKPAPVQVLMSKVVKKILESQ
ncbi:MAG: hypothetical protein ABII23_09000, partial [bacterium]